VLYVPADVPRGGPPWDAIGSLLVMGGLFALVLAIKSVAETPLPVWRTLLAGVSALALLYGFQRWQQRSAVPLIDFSLLRLPGFAAGVAGAGLGTAGIVGLELLLGQHLQLVRGLSPLQTGLFLLPAPLGSFVAGPLAGALLHRHGSTPVGAGGLLLAAAAALALLALPTTAGISLGSMLLLGLVGLGVGAAASAASSAIMSGAPPGRAGMAASLEEVSYELGSALGVAVFGSLMTLVYVTVAGRALVDRTLDAAAFTRALQAVLVGVALLWVVTGLAMLRSARAVTPARAS
jgi:MFS transporter, DHA2 family, multidrug resistance protein